MTRNYRFEELEAAVWRIARHRESPEKRDAITECLDDIERRFNHRTLTGHQKELLVAILLRDEEWAWRDDGEGA
jgi:hypothetical protein